MTYKMPLALLLLPACVEREPTAEQAMEAVAAADLDAIVAMLQDAADAIAALGVVPTTTEDPTDGLGTCVWTQSLDGNAVTGTLTLAPDSVPCGGEATANGRSFTYTVTAGSMAGSWALGRDGVLSLELSGDRAAEASFTGPRADDRAWDAALTLDAATADIDGDTVVGWAIAGSWDGMGGHSWTLDASADTASVQGTITSSTGGSCTVSGTLDAPQVACASARQAGSG